MPSIARLTSDHYAVKCSLTHERKCWSLTAINTDTTNSPECTRALFNSAIAQDSGTTGTEITTHLDVFSVHRAIERVQLVVEVVSESAPDDYLLVVSRRQQSLASTDAPIPLRPVCDVRGISQMTQPSAQRSRTCSPTALSMLMSYHGAHYHPAFVDRCKEPNSQLYGVWPLNIMQASRRGFVGAVELISDWQALANSPTPFVASVRFEAGELKGAPLPKTAGHLVLVCGTTETQVLCNDPAAPRASGVARHYDLRQFTQAWLGFRGATYIVVPAKTPLCTVTTAR